MSLDSTIVQSLNTVANSTPLLSALTVFTASWLPYLITGVFAWYLLQHKQLIGINKLLPFIWALAAGLIARFLFTSPIRYFFPRDRPFLTLDIHQLITVHASSFPSGHASFLFGFSTIVFAYNKKLGIAAFSASTLVCIARIAAGIHYPSDIVAGMFVGLIAGVILLWFVHTFTKGAEISNVV